MSMQSLKSEFLLKLTTDNWKRQESHAKNSFWPTDCLKPSIELYWKFTHVPESDPIQPEKLLMFKAAAAYEHEVIRNLVAIGEAVDVYDTELCEKMGLNIFQRAGDVPQIRLAMEREFIPVTGYLDGITPTGIPIEVKSYYSSKVDNELAKGLPPAEHYLHQLAVQMDFLGVLRGILVSVNRSTGNIFFSELTRESTDSLIFTLGDRSIGLTEYESEEESDSGDTDFLGHTTQFDLGLEYKRWRRLMEDHIIPMKQPPLDYEYRPAITKELLDKYGEDKIKKAIKGERILSDHRWQPQYSNYKTLWAQTEAEQKGFKSVADLCAYSNSDIQTMMAWGNWEWRTDKNKKRKLFKKKS